jgi:hypothetical protein
MSAMLCYIYSLQNVSFDRKRQLSDSDGARDLFFFSSFFFVLAEGSAIVLPRTTVMGKRKQQRQKNQGVLAACKS